MAGAVATFFVYGDTPHLFRLSPYYKHQDARKNRIGGQSAGWHNLDQNLSERSVGYLQFTTPPMNLRTLICTAVRVTLIQNGDQTCSEIVRGMGLNPSKHKGTVHAIMVEMEKEGILGAWRTDSGKRDKWFIWENRIRKRDRLIAALFA